MDKFNNSNSSLALQKFYNQQNNVRLLELQQRLKTEQIVCQIELTKAGSPDFVFRHSVINEEPGSPIVSSDTMQVIIEEQTVEEQNQQEPLSGESLGEIYYRSNENFEIDKPITLERTKSTIINQTKINNLIKLKKW